MTGETGIVWQVALAQETQKGRGVYGIAKGRSPFVTRLTFLYALPTTQPRALPVFHRTSHVTEQYFNKSV